ncbi:hypothetical protein BVC80_9089g51 [Macleaya cordata]|uniref:Uncharacterized protein n=1 Tax=Macleaya cordata TaxID=56857 RepID=A0A200PQG0_MACCD|nr:hypothetical protein BVC80_9089g51 [Macleaya cordata]
MEAMDEKQGSNGGMGQIPMSLSQVSNITNAIQQQLRSGNITQAQAVAITLKLRMAQRRALQLQGPDQSSGIAGMTTSSATGQMDPESAAGLSILGRHETVPNRANNIIHLQSENLASMCPPKMTPAAAAGTNGSPDQFIDSGTILSSMQLSSSQTLGSVGSTTTTSSPTEV